MKKYLFTPGPVPVSEHVALSAARQTINHRGSDFHELFSSIQKKLGHLLRSEGSTILLPASGTGALECLATNLAGPETKILSISCGVFGDRFREIAARTGAQIVPVDIAPGEGVSPERVCAALADAPDCFAILLTHNETSTGVRNPIADIVAALPEKNCPFVLVDGVSSVGAMPCYPQEWGVDGLATASQKGLLAPPGLGLVWLSERAWDRAEARTCSSYYFDLALQRKHLRADAPENPYTPPVTLYYALDAALDEILSEDWFTKRERAASAFTAGIESLGFELLVRDAKYRSPGVTAFSLPNGETGAVSKALKGMGLDVAGGQGSLKGKIVRLAHYHDFNWPEISLALGALYAALGEKRNGSGDFMRAAFEKMEG